jgi:hypothetical protein
MRRLPGELSLSDWLNHAGLTLILGDDRVIEGGLPYKPGLALRPDKRSVCPQLCVALIVTCRMGG